MKNPSLTITTETNIVQISDKRDEEKAMIDAFDGLDSHDDAAADAEAAEAVFEGLEIVSIYGRIKF